MIVVNGKVVGQLHLAVCVRLPPLAKPVERSPTPGDRIRHTKKKEQGRGNNYYARKGLRAAKTIFMDFNEQIVVFISSSRVNTNL